MSFNELIYNGIKINNNFYRDVSVMLMCDKMTRGVKMSHGCMCDILTHKDDNLAQRGELRMVPNSTVNGILHDKSV